MRRDHWLRAIERLDPETEYERIYQISSQHEFPWDLTQALSFALFRTYAVPRIGRLLAETGEFTARTQKRYDDTALILGEILEHGAASPRGRAAVRRMNQMHGRYPIANADLVYVLSTFVVVPKRWLDAYGWRSYSEVEIQAITNYYRTLGRLMNIRDIPQTYLDFERTMDEHERSSFAFDEGGRAVSDATLGLLDDWYPGPLGRVMRLVSLCLMDDPLRTALGYPAPPPRLRQAVRSALRFRGRVERLLPARRTPFHARMSRTVRSYPDGFDVIELGTFPDQPAARPSSPPRPL
jgi:hypothetical protein